MFIKNLFDINYLCEPYEAISEVTNSIPPESFIGLQLDLNKQFSPITWPMLSNTIKSFSFEKLSYIIH